MRSLLSDSILTNANFLKKVTYLKSKLKFDAVTYKHSLNVANMCVKLLQLLDCDISENMVFYAGLFHDIGKTTITKTILNKESNLSKSEFSQIKDHTTQGYRILLKHRFPPEIFLSAHLHHEKYDGTGYPLGLTADETPLIARIVSICDVFDALTSDRPYRKAFSADEALQIMTDSGSHFDPELLSILTANCSRFIRTC